MEIAESTPYFLKGGGEMGALTRNFDWSSTSIGDPENWTQSLRIIVSVILSSKFPMFLWWGDEMIQFYNDAYRPSLGNDGKHPLALGQKGAECWPEIWDIIYPLITQVRTTGEATWSEDQLIPIYRNGKIEDVYWTFGYSAVRGESGNVDGVLVVCTETTDKVKNIRQLRESEDRFRNLIGESAVATTVFNGRNLIIELANDSILQLWGRDRSIIGMPLLEAMPEIKDQPYPKILQDVFDTGKIYSAESALVYIKRNGKLDAIYRDFTYKPIFDDERNVTGIIAIVVDVTERVMAERKLMESEQQVRSLVESAPFPIGVYTGEDMRIILANQSIIDAWGKGNNVIGKRYAEILPELGNQAIFDQLNSVFTTGQAFHARNQRVDITVDGSIRTYYFNYSFTPLYDGLGNVYGVMNTAADVTDLNVAKLKVEENERNIRNTILKAPVAMCIFRGGNHVVEIANDRMIELWGRAVEDVMNKPIFVGLPEARNQGFEEILDSVFETGETYTAHDLEISLPRNGKISAVYVTFVYEAYREPDGTISGIIAVANDVTAQVLARKKIEELVAERTKELADTNISLQRSNAELAQFAYIASHDLQEPIRKVGTFAQMLEQNLGQIDERSQKYLDKITSSASRMTTLIRDVLAYSQLSKDHEIFTTVSLEEIVKGIEGDFELLIEQKGASVRIVDLPVVMAIPLQMSQLFGNLISNGLKFSRKSIPPVITISAAVAQKNDLARFPNLDMNLPFYNIEFKDNGIGFDQEHAEQIFNIFQRLHGKAEYAGTGIGLAMCKKIAQNHHGDIYATGRPGHGTTINIILPRHQPL